jgi:hypothetical protein
MKSGFLSEKTKAILEIVVKGKTVISAKRVA